MDNTQIVNEFFNLISNTFDNPVFRRILILLLFLGVYGAFSVIFVLISILNFLFKLFKEKNKNDY
jgi:hypothetical protein